MHTRGFPNLFLMGGMQSAVTPNFTEMYNEQSQHVAYVVAEAIRKGARTVEASEQAAQLTQQLQAYSGASPFELRPVDVSEEIAARSDLLRTAVGERGRLEIALADDLPRVDADPSLLLQAVLNLATNAAEACEASDGLVTVSTGLVQIAEPAPVAAS